MNVPNLLIKTGIITIICLFLTSAQAQIAQGRWEITQVVVEKNNNGNMDTTVYHSAAEVKSYIRFPQIWEVKDSGTIVVQYSDGEVETDKYTLDGKQLKIDRAVEMQCFQYSLSEENLTLRITYYYISNMPGGKIEHIEEKWTIDLKKKK